MDDDCRGVLFPDRNPDALYFGKTLTLSEAEFTSQVSRYLVNVCGIEAIEGQEKNSLGYLESRQVSQLWNRRLNRQSTTVIASKYSRPFGSVLVV